MKKINLFLTILAAAAGFTNCSKAELVENKETGNGETVVYATTDAATKTTLADDYKVLWSTGDQIKFIKDGASSTTYTFTLSSGSGTSNGTFTCGETPVEGTYTVYYPATYDGTNWPAQTYVSATDISGAPMTATATVSGGIVSDISFKNEGGILRYTVKGTKTIKSINVKSSSPALNVTLNCGDGVALATGGTVFNIALPAGEYSNATLRFIATDNTVATKTAGTFTVTKNKVSLATFESLTYLPEGALKGVFTVGKGADGTAGTSDDVKVRFSQGNLYYDGSDSKFKFEANQYSFADSWDASHVSHFYWSKSVDEAVKEEYDWGQDVAENDVFFTNETETTSKNDFTVNVGGTEQTGWRTLSTAEWQYLFNSRSNASSLYKCGVTVCGKTNCVVLLPDDWQWGQNGVGDTWQKNTGVIEYREETNIKWSTMEAAGAVCLPAAGDRGVSHVLNVGDHGIYWSSTELDSDYAYTVYFLSNVVYPVCYDFSRDIGCSVRLITESK